MRESDAKRKEIGIAVRFEILSILKSQIVKNAIKTIALGQSAVEMPNLIPNWVTKAILTDLELNNTWSEEYWQLQPSGDVSLATSKKFSGLKNTKKFSWNECLRHPDFNSYSLRGFLSAIVSTEASKILSISFGEQVKFRSADIARYKKGHYLRRHADLFEDRRFGLIWFFNKNWNQGSGGELIVENPAGCCVVLPPFEGTLVALLIKPDYFHQVAMINSNTWIRYSIASHYHINK